MFAHSFEAIYVVNLRRRADRRAEMRQELARFGLADDPRVSFFDAVEPDDMGCFQSRGAKGCYMSHLTILEREAALDRPVLILEDDCDFTRLAATYELPESWDIFYGGYTAENPDDLQNSNIIGSHCIGYTPRAVKKAAAYLRNLLDLSFPPDPKAAADSNFDPAIRPPFDGAIVWFRRAHPELTTVFAPVSVQRASRSDIGDRGWLERHAPAALATARKAKNWLRRRA